jgi:hypothetical protein
VYDDQHGPDEPKMRKRSTPKAGEGLNWCRTSPETAAKRTRATENTPPSNESSDALLTRAFEEAVAAEVRAIGERGVQDAANGSGDAGISADQRRQLATLRVARMARKVADAGSRHLQGDTLTYRLAPTERSSSNSVGVATQLPHSSDERQWPAPRLPPPRPLSGLGGRTIDPSCSLRGSGRVLAANGVSRSVARSTTSWSANGRPNHSPGVPVKPGVY